MQEGVSYLKIVLLLFLKISELLVVCICYCYNFDIFLSFASESGVARNTVLLQRDVLWTGKI